MSKTLFAIMVCYTIDFNYKCERTCTYTNVMDDSSFHTNIMYTGQALQPINGAVWLTEIML